MMVIINHYYEGYFPDTVCESEFTPRREKLNVSDIVKRVVSILRHDAEAKSLTITDRIPCRLPCVEGDKVQIEQLLSNLIQNAIRFTPAGGRIDLAGGSDGTDLRLGVFDNGVGMTESQISEASARSLPALGNVSLYAGQGLPNAFAIVEALGGTIDIESDLGCGSSFTITLPQRHGAVRDHEQCIG